VVRNFSTIERFIIVLLANSADVLKDPAAPKERIRYLENEKLRDNACKKIVNSKYLK